MSDAPVISKVQRGDPASPIIPGFLVAQGEAIRKRLQIPFPPSLFMFKVLPPRIDARKWATLTSGNQPFIGLGFVGFRPGERTGGPLQGAASWTVLVAVRHAQATDASRYYGDVYGIGALTLAEVASSVLHNHAAPGGKISVQAVTNIAADEWGDDTVIIKIDLSIPLTLPLYNAIIQPDGLGWFDVLSSQWGWAAQDGTNASFTSEWDNPNAQPTD